MSFELPLSPEPSISLHLTCAVQEEKVEMCPIHLGPPVHVAIFMVVAFEREPNNFSKFDHTTT